jgi:hypothetical protein
MATAKGISIITSNRKKNAIGANIAGIIHDSFSVFE